MTDERYLSARDIRARLGISLSTAYELLAQMPRVKFGANVRVAESAFQNWVKRHEVIPVAQSLEARRAQLEAYKRALGLADDKPDEWRIRPTRPRDRKPEPVGFDRPIRPTRPRD